jgi:heme/copper-type cytochrome/quinol oxidase subunit 3
VSTIGAFVFAAGFLVFAWDCVRSKRREPYAKRNSWNAGTLEWATPVPAPSYGMRSIPKVTSRYPLWDDKEYTATLDEGRGLLAHAREGKRETLVTSVLDAQPLQVLRVGAPTWLPMIAAFGLGAVFIFSTYKLWVPTGLGGVVFIVALMRWLWTGTAVIPEADTKDAGGGLRLPLYVSGVRSTGWWAMFITMTGDLTAFLSLIFGYFFFWTVHPEFPPVGIDGPGWAWPTVSAIFAATAWGATVAARELNAADRVPLARTALLGGFVSAALSAAALVAGPVTTGLDPTTNSYPAIVWALVVWIVLHLATGMLMQGYCLARSIYGKMTPRYDADIRNVALYWHFAGFSALLTALVIGGFPLLT